MRQRQADDAMRSATRKRELSRRGTGTQRYQRTAGPGAATAETAAYRRGAACRRRAAAAAAELKSTPGL